MPMFVRTSIFLLVSLSFADLAHADRANDEKMAREAMGPYVRSTLSSEEKQRRITEHHENVRQIAARRSAAEGSATVVFRGGVTTDEFLTLVSKYQLSVIDVHIKTPYDDDGVIQSIRLGASTIQKWNGSPEEQLRKAIGSIRYNFMEMASSIPENGDAESNEVAAAYKRMALTPWKIYRAEVYGGMDSLRKSLNDRRIALVVPDSDEKSASRIDSHKRLKRRFAERRTRVAADRARLEQ